jgi:GAF domain-containing protein
VTRQPETEELPSIESLAEAADRASRLQRVTERLSESVTPQEVLDAILTDGLRAAEARAGAIGIVTDDEQAIELLAESGYEPRVMEEWGRFPVAAETPMSYVVRTGVALFIETTEERNELFPNLAGRGESHALAVLPLLLEGELKGVLGHGLHRRAPTDEDHAGPAGVPGARASALVRARARSTTAPRVHRGGQ